MAFIERLECIKLLTDCDDNPPIWGRLLQINPLILPLRIILSFRKFLLYIFEKYSYLIEPCHQNYRS